MAEIREIGIVHSDFKESADPYEMRKHESRITVFESFEEGLYGIEENSHILVLFHFDRSVDYTLKGPRYHGEVKGVFASRSPRRPGNVGCTVVELLERNGPELRVRGLDALDGTPVLDIKPYAPGLDEKQSRAVDRDRQARRPRAHFLPMLKNGDAESLFFEAGRFHGEYCPGLALGVLAALGSVRELSEAAGTGIAELVGTGVPEKIYAVSYLGGCFVDGLQYVTGCTVGNGLLRMAAGGPAGTAAGNAAGAAAEIKTAARIQAPAQDRTGVHQGAGVSVRAVLKQSFGELLDVNPFELIHRETNSVFSLESGSGGE